VDEFVALSNLAVLRSPLPCADFFDIIAGTSTGGLLALYLASRGRTYDTLGSKRRLGLKGEDRLMQEAPNDPTYHRKVRPCFRLQGALVGC
jgi:hypothetical protein